MKLGCRVALWMLLLGAGLPATWSVCTGWIPGGTPTWRELGEYGDTLRRGRQLDDELQALLRVVEWRHQSRRQIARQVLAGQLSLSEAAARFRALNEQPPAIAEEAYRCYYPGRTDIEHSYHEVVRFVELTLADEGISSNAVVDRLRKELRELRPRPAQLRLPPTPRTTAPLK